MYPLIQQVDTMKAKKVARHKLKNDLKHWLGLAIHDEITLIDFE